LIAARQELRETFTLNAALERFAIWVVHRYVKGSETDVTNTKVVPRSLDADFAASSDAIESTAAIDVSADPWLGAGKTLEIVVFEMGGHVA